ncbi:unnamed protein product [Parascedosporium putredinis]|uniref:Sulfite efflux pump SSU1 n=1 Tax=Parascedosporium putredinis TaxID=1442378 RepID=A0A9P1M8X9_9PEZI|nr:unnamed protein product [Parascedosporium putredinis]CAI7993596.1 unnamed protein product [Parascedosporium putredinis]
MKNRSSPNRRAHDALTLQVGHEAARMAGQARPIPSQAFLIPQGTGILAATLHQLEYQFRGLDTISVILWFIAFITLFAFFIVYVLKVVLCPRQTGHAITHNTVEAACLSSISISFTSAIQMLCMVVVPSWGGPGWEKAAYILWWINTAMAVSACFVLLPMFIKTLHAEGGLQRSFTPVTQLPIIAVLTSAAGAGTLCQYAMLSPEQKVPMIIVGYLQIGIGIPIALALDTLFWARQYLPWVGVNDGLSLPKRQVYVEMILCGPWGQGASRCRFTFTLTNWSVVFPWGVYANAAVQLGKITDSVVFRVWSTIMATALAIIWIICALFTIRGVFKRNLLGPKPTTPPLSATHSRSD